MKDVLKQMIPQKALAILRNRVICPLCESQVRNFVPFGIVVQRNNAMCPYCGALERHRAQWVWFQNNLELNNNIRILHIAPEGCFSSYFKNKPNIDYIQCDLYPHPDSVGVIKMDVTDLKLEDNSFDLVICNQVLEHIPDDEKAISEIYRVIKPGGVALLSVPIYAEKTFEDASITSPEERLKAYMQSDHVRLCGFDYVDRLKAPNMEVTTIDYEKNYSKFVKRLYALNEEKNFVDLFYICKKS